MTTPDRAGRFDVDGPRTSAANRRWWDAEAGEYLGEHRAFLGDDELVWGPEGWTEPELGLLGEVAGRDVLEVGAGAAQGARWCRTRGARAVATDLSYGMLAGSRHIDAEREDVVPVAQADASLLPFADASFDIVFSAYGAVPFIADTAALMRELARVLRPGGLLAFSTTHPLRWALPDVPGESGLQIVQSYFDPTPYAEAAGSTITYVEHHRTTEGRVRELLDAGFALTDLRELPWKPSTTQTWGGWSPLRGELVPGTLVLCGRRLTPEGSVPSPGA